MLKIGPLLLPNKVILAPMAGITDSPFRKIIREFGSGLLCGEMVSAMALHYNSKSTRGLLRFDAVEKPLSLQIFGSDPAIMAEAAQIVAATGVDIIDINMGCPVPKVVKNGDGAALLNNLPLAEAIIKAVVSAVKIPVTVKCRLGWDHNHIVAPELARIAENCGAAAIAIHARTRDQFYRGEADWDAITTVKRQLSIPVIGNGDVNTPQAALRLLEQTGCDGVMIGQGCLGRPWIFRQVIAFLQQGTLEPEIAFDAKMAVILRHLELQVQHSGEERGIKEMRKHFGWYLKGLSGAAGIRDKINKITSWDQLKELLEEFALANEAREKIKD